MKEQEKQRRKAIESQKAAFFRATNDGENGITGIENFHAKKSQTTERKLQVLNLDHLR